MRLFEYQSKQLLSDFGLAFTQSKVIDSPAAAAAEFERIGAPVVLKVQTPFGGRAKAGGVAFAETTAQVRDKAQALLDMEIRGFNVTQVSIEPRVAFSREFYFGVTWDCGARLPVVLLSIAGGVDVEASTSAALVRKAFDPSTGLSAYKGREMAARLGLAGKVLVGVGAIVERMARAFLDLDAVTLEINPLVETTDGRMVGLDAHLEIDDDACARQRRNLSALGEIVAMTGSKPPTPLEVEAARIDAMDHRGVAGRLVEFDGDLGLLIGGGGASLTTFDAIRRHGGRPANYCELGGNPTEEKVAGLTRVLLSKPGVRKLSVIMNVLNNTRADIIARGILAGIRAAGRDPAETICVFRVPGSWENEARAILAEVDVEAFGRERSLDACARLSAERMTRHVV